jgi:hypothetical protein
MGALRLHAKKINPDGSRQLSPALTACGLDAGGWSSVTGLPTATRRIDNDDDVTCKRCVAALHKAGLR